MTLAGSSNCPRCRGIYVYPNASCACGLVWTCYRSRPGMRLTDSQMDSCAYSSCSDLGSTIPEYLGMGGPRGMGGRKVLEPFHLRKGLLTKFLHRSMLLARIALFLKVTMDLPSRNVFRKSTSACAATIAAALGLCCG